MLAQALATTSLSIAMIGAAAALPVSPPPATTPVPVVRTAGGCGLAYHRNRFGFCVPNLYYGGPVRLPPPCPRFYHRAPNPATPLCYPNF